MENNDVIVVVWSFSSFDFRFLIDFEALFFPSLVYNNIIDCNSINNLLI